LAKISIAFGGLLILLGIIGFVATGSEHYTALIPAAAGMLLEVCGALALNPKLRMHAMHGAAMIGVLGFAGTIPGLISAIKWLAGTAPARPAAVVSQVIMCALCALFVALCVKSFIDARRNREAQGFPANPTS
jgi:hypothetical protein